MFANLDQLNDILEPDELERLELAAKNLDDGADSGEVYRMLRVLYDQQDISLTSFCRIFNWLADEELPVMTYRNHSIDRLARTAAPPIQKDAPDDIAGKLTEGRREIGFQFKPLGKLGEGGSGEVLIARDIHLERRVALKRLKQFELVPEAIKKRFINEAQVTAQLDHPNIIPIYGLQAEEGKHLGYAMKLVRGHHLGILIEETRALIKGGKRLDEEHALNNRLDYFLKVCDAIDFAHSKGVLHRDLKPQNIMIGRFHEVYVMDWGIARLTYGGADRDLETVQPVVTDSAVDATQTEKGGWGTPLYMSPEQAGGEPVDERSDQYTLGLILFELVCLRRANAGTNRMEVMTRAARAHCEPVRHIMPRRRIPRELTAIIQKATAKNPLDRYPSVHDLAADIRRFLRGDEILARPDSLSEKLMRQIGRHQQVALVMILLTVFLAAATLIWNFSQARERAMRLAAEQSRKLSRLVDRTNDQAQAIDNFFRTYETAVSNLATEVETLLAHNTDHSGTVYSAGLFDQGEVPGIQHSKGYNRQISPAWPTFYAMQNPGDAQAAFRAKALSPIQPHLRELMTLNLPPPRNDHELDRYILTKKSPLVWVHIVFGDGSMLLFPGVGGFPETYDPRTRPWYRVNEVDDDIVWHDIYHTLTETDPEMPCSALLRDTEGRPIGQVTINIACDRFSQELLPIRRAGVIDTYLLNAEGAVLATAGRSEIDVDTDVNAPVTRPFPYPTELGKLKKKRHTEIIVDGRKRWLACRRLATQDWYYVVEVDPALWGKEAL